jgi:hypothetical protein
MKPGNLSVPWLLLAIAPGIVVTHVGARADDEGTRAVCALVLHQEREERDDITLELDLARSQADAAQQVFVLLDGLWQNDALERMHWLRGKHHRDMTRLGVDLAQRLLEEQEAVVRQYDGLCAALLSGEDATEDRGAAEDIYARYRRADCEARAIEVELAKVDLEFHLEYLASVRDLRENDVATQPDVIFAERDVEMIRKRVARTEQRARRCREELGPENETGAE